MIWSGVLVQRPHMKRTGASAAGAAGLLHATCAIASRELCRSKTDASEKPVAESNLSLRVLAHVAAQGAIVSGCLYG